MSFSCSLITKMSYLLHPQWRWAISFSLGIDELFPCSLVHMLMTPRSSTWTLGSGPGSCDLKDNFTQSPHHRYRCHHPNWGAWPLLHDYIIVHVLGVVLLWVYISIGQTSLGPIFAVHGFNLLVISHSSQLLLHGVYLVHLWAIS